MEEVRRSPLICQSEIETPVAIDIGGGDALCDHRIGQAKPVHACRIIAKDTVEEKVLALQQSKRSLADAIITADNSLLRSIAREDLELLLS